MHRHNSNPAKCGRVRIRPDVEIWQGPGGYRLSGLVTCGSVWACPVCSWKIAIGRGKEVQNIIDRHAGAGGGVYLVTATLPHDQGNALKPLREAVSNAWRKVTTRRQWRNLQQQIGYIGFVRALEVTHGENGWHPHLHILLFTKRPLQNAVKGLLESYLYEAWVKAIIQAGYRPPTREHGLTVEDGRSAGHYVAKVTSGLAGEVATSAGKYGRNGSRTPLQILEDYGNREDPRDRQLWLEWISGMHGARQLTYSRGIRERYMQDGEKTDAELAADAEIEDDVLAYVIPGRSWDRLIRLDRQLTGNLMCLLETRGLDYAIRYLDRIYKGPP